MKRRSSVHDVDGDRVEHGALVHGPDLPDLLKDLGRVLESEGELLLRLDHVRLVLWFAFPDKRKDVLVIAHRDFDTVRRDSKERLLLRDVGDVAQRQHHTRPHPIQVHEEPCVFVSLLRLGFGRL